jgi:hypothetical protein
MNAEDVLVPLSICLGGLGFILGTIPRGSQVVNEYRDRSSHAETLKERLGACQAKFLRWEGHWGTSELQERHGLSIKTFKQMEKGHQHQN